MAKEPLDTMIDDGDEWIFDMGMYPICAAMFDTIHIGHIIDEETPPRASA